MFDVLEWIGEVHRAGGSDLLNTAGLLPQARIDGVYESVGSGRPLTADDTRSLIEGMLAEEQLAQLETDRQIDFAFSWRDQLRVRGNAFMQRGTLAVALRLIPLEVPTISELGLPAVVADLAEKPSGLVLVTGPTGSGKSTTLAALVDHVNSTRALHILTVEDPVEYVHPHRRSVVNQREIGIDATSFSEALRAALREDPDVILVGEMRDLESIAITLTLAETGHLVFATLHTNDTAQALDRIVDVFPSDRRDQIQVQLSASLQGVVYQRLVRRVGGGMIAAFEVMTATNAVRNLVREGKTRQLRNVVATQKAEGMQTLESSLSELVEAGEVDLFDARAVSLFPDEVVEHSTPLIRQYPDSDGEDSDEGYRAPSHLAPPAEAPRRRRLRG